MKYAYLESNKDLAARINTHAKLAKKDIEPWIIRNCKLRRNEIVLDVGCGNGKQIDSFNKKVKGKGVFIGVDLSKELLNNVKKRKNVVLVHHNMDKKFPFPDESFDLINCGFAIYYAKNIKKVLKEFSRMLKKDGRIFITGPALNNADELWYHFKSVTGKKIPMKHRLMRRRIHDEVIPSMKKLFKKVKASKFINELEFTKPIQFKEYLMAAPFFHDAKGTKAEAVAMILDIKDIIDSGDVPVITKRVYGVLGYKR